ncbi:alpha/beta hydrolase family protein [Nocardia cyriacigeorgica]|uniref:alpha/beta hydrolase family protein n=1 Tax=Nocardia cyriacigeorgica TaxID=135487 RepID=UPI002811EAD1|nr:lipase family protein [Nocardia cyriacigeorgica]
MKRTRISTVTVGAVVAVAVVLANPVAASAVEAPGTVIDSVALSGRVQVPAAASSHRLTYWSRGPRAPMQSTAAVYLPPGTPPAGGWPILAYAHGSVGIADHCAFTANPRDYYLDTLYPRLLEAGYAVVISDYVGLGTPGTHPYLDGPSQARSVIDGVRAARWAIPELSAQWAVLGQSQGGQTALFTAHIAAADAPELDFRGAAATGAPSNLELAVPLAGPWIPRLPLRRTTTYFGLLLAGLRVTAPELDIDSYLTPVGREVLRIVESDCVPEAAAQVDEIAIGAMLNRPLDDPALWAAAETMMRIPTSGYPAPLFVAQGLADREVPAPLSAKLIAELRASGTDIQVAVYPGDHLEAADQALPDVLEFLRRIFGRQ